MLPGPRSCQAAKKLDCPTWTHGVCVLKGEDASLFSFLAFPPGNILSEIHFLENPQNASPVHDGAVAMAMGITSAYLRVHAVGSIARRHHSGTQRIRLANTKSAKWDITKYTMIGTFTWTGLESRISSRYMCVMGWPPLLYSVPDDPVIWKA